MLYVLGLVTLCLFAQAANVGGKKLPNPADKKKEKEKKKEAEVKSSSPT